MRSRRLAIAAVAFMLLVVALLYAIRQESSVPGAPASMAPPPQESAGSTPSRADPSRSEVEESSVLLAAGDVACDAEAESRDEMEGTAALVQSLLEEADGPTMVAPLGDLSADGRQGDFEGCYERTWGAFREITRPAIGNHDRANDAEAYFDYWDDLDMPTPGGYYSYKLGAWQAFVLNTNCGDAGGCEQGDAQYEWLKESLEEVNTGNILAYWHKPRFSIGKHGEFRAITDAYELLEEAGADIILSGHDHTYQRWAPQEADGTMDSGAPRQFVVGTGGSPLRPFEPDDDLDVEALEFHQDEEHGVLRLELQSCAYRWEFISVDGTVLDKGRVSDTC